jgi:hypothetical protein
MSKHSIHSKLRLVLESVDFPQFIKSTPHVPRGSSLEEKDGSQAGKNSISSTPNSRNLSSPSPTAFVFSRSSVAEDDSTAGENEMRAGDDR